MNIIIKTQSNVHLNFSNTNIWLYFLLNFQNLISVRLALIWFGFFVKWYINIRGWFIANANLLKELKWNS